MSSSRALRGTKVLLIVWLGVSLLNGCGKDEEHVRREESDDRAGAAQQQAPAQVYVPVYVSPPGQQQWPQPPQPPQQWGAQQWQQPQPPPQQQQQQWGAQQWPAQPQPVQPQPGTGYGTAAPPQYGSQGTGYGAAPRYGQGTDAYGNRLQYNAPQQPWGSTYQPGGVYGQPSDQSHGQYQYRPLDEKPTGRTTDQRQGTPPAYYGSPYGYGGVPYGGIGYGAWPGYYGGVLPGTGVPVRGRVPGRRRAAGVVTSHR